jgi:hypothetical protein
MKSGTLLVLRAVVGLGVLLLVGACDRSSAIPGEGTTGVQRTVDLEDVYTSTSPSPYPSEFSPSSDTPDPNQVGGLAPTDPKGSDIPRSSVGELVMTPGEIYGPTPEQKLVLDQAHFAVAKDCMERRGHAFLSPPPVLEGPTLGITPWDGNVGLIDRDYAKIHGYQRDSDDILVVIYGTPDYGRIDTQNWSLEYEAALVEEGGCADVATAAIEEGSPDVSKETEVLTEIGHAGFDRTVADPEFVKAMEGWSACMKASGYVYDDFVAPASEYGSGFVGRNLEFDGRAPARGEVETALTDMTCKDRVDLIGHYQRVLWKHWSSLMEESRPILEKLKEHWIERVDHANELIAQYR